MKNLAETFEVPVYGTDNPVTVKKSKVKLPRLGIYHPWTASMDEGWTRLVLDNFKFAYKQVYNREIKQGKLAEKFDVIIIPDLSIASLVEGKRRWRGEAYLGSPQKPEKYRGGIGKEGTKTLTDFVKAGGTLICFGQASNFAMEKMRVPAVNVLKDKKGNEFYSPGSLLEVELDPTHPISYGMPGRAAIRMTNSPAFRLLLHNRESRAVAYYGEETALAEIPVEKGRVILFGFRVQSRAQTFATFKLLFNAIYMNGVPR